MSKNEVTDPITDQEIAFVHLGLSGTMTDQQAAQAAGLNPDTAAHTKSKPSVRAYIEQRARMQQPVQQQHLAQEIDGLRRQPLDREQVLARLWEIANLSPEMTRNSVTGQVKALTLIIAIEGLIPDRRATSAEKKPAPPPNPSPSPSPSPSKIYQSAWLRQQQQTTDPESKPVADAPATPPAQPAAGAPSNPAESTITNPISRSETQPPASPAFAPGLRVPYGVHENRFGRRR